MLTEIYPIHDMNIVFDMFEDILKGGDVHENAGRELTLLNKLFANLPAEAVEYGMQFLHGKKDLPVVCADIMPLYIRFLSFAEYCAKIKLLREVPSNMTTEEIMKRHEMMTSLDEHEAKFGESLMGFKFNGDDKEVVADEAENSEQAKEGEGLHLMNNCAIVWPCADPLKTSCFYEQKCGFKAVHLEDEAMPHIRLTRDNLVIILVKCEIEIKPLHTFTDIKYDLYIYVSEPFMLFNEIKNNGVTIIEELPEAEASQNAATNRQFVFEDIDGRRVCVSQSTEVF